MTEDEIVQEIAHKFNVFGRGSVPPWNNPIAVALADKEPMFAAGVDVREVVRFVLEKAET